MAGRRDEARELATEALDLVREHIALAANMGPATIALDVLGLHDEVIRLLELAPPGPWVEAIMAEAQGDFARACELYAIYGAPTFEAESSLLAGEKLIAAGRRDEALPFLESALAFYRTVGATFFIQRGEELLAKSA
jgi:hypothetical protein